MVCSKNQRVCRGLLAPARRSGSLPPFRNLCLAAQWHLFPPLGRVGRLWVQPLAVQGLPWHRLAPTTRCDFPVAVEVLPDAGGRLVYAQHPCPVRLRGGACYAVAGSTGSGSGPGPGKAQRTGDDNQRRSGVMPDSTAAGPRPAAVRCAYETNRGVTYPRSPRMLFKPWALNFVRLMAHTRTPLPHTSEETTGEGAMMDLYQNP